MMQMMGKKHVLYLFLVVSKQHSVDAARIISSVKPLLMETLALSVMKPRLWANMGN